MAEPAPVYLKAYPFYSDPDTIAGYGAFCPACKVEHLFLTTSYDDHPVWGFDGNMEKPTFQGSMLANKREWPGRPKCHSFLENGRWRFLDDCTHEAAGQTMDMIPYPPEYFGPRREA